MTIKCSLKGLTPPAPYPAFNRTRFLGGVSPRALEGGASDWSRGGDKRPADPWEVIGVRQRVGLVAGRRCCTTCGKKVAFAATEGGGKEQCIRIERAP